MNITYKESIIWYIKINSMNFYSNFFAATYAFYARFKREEPKFSAVCIVATSQVMTIFIGFVLLRKYNIFNFQNYLPNKYYALPFLVLWLWGVYKYFSPRETKIMEAFNRKSESKKRWLNLVAILAFFVPLILFFVLLIK